MIDVKSISGEVLVSVPILKDAVSHEELMTSDYIQLHWDSDKGDVLPLGAYIEHNEERYSLLEPYSPSRQNEGVFRYSPQFHSRIIRWQKIIVPVYTYNEDGVTVKSRELDWNFTGTPADAMYMVKQALKNELGEEWNTTLGNDLPETITIAAQSSSVWSILSEIAEQCETEWWAEKKAQWLHLSKCNHGVSVDLEVGKNVKVPSTVQSGQEYFTRFYAFGSSRNVTQMESAVQGSIVNKRLTLDPAKYPGGYKDIRGHFSGGVYVSDLHPEEVMVKSLYFDEVYPSSKLTIAEVRKRMRYHTDDDGNYIRIGGTDVEPIYDQYAIWYFKIPGFDFKEEMIIENLELSVAFKSGELRGREFALTYHPKDKKVADKADVDKEFSVKAGEYEITFDKSDYLIVPGVSYIIPHDGDEITVFNIEMPQEYKESAYLELERELDKEIDRLTKDNKSYEVDSNPVAFYEGGIDIHLGQSVNFTNNNELLATRVMMVEKHIDYPFEQRIRIGNEIVKGSRQQLKDEVRNVGEEVRRMNKYESSSSVIQKDHSRELMLTMGRYLAMKDTMDMLQGAVEGFTEGINPVTVETMALLVGNEALQFKFVKSRTDFTLIHCPLVYNEQTKQLNAAPCALVHLTLDIDSITAPNVRKNTDYKAWDMEEWHSEIFTDATKKYYVYAVVEANGTAGTYEFVPDNAEPIGMRDKLDSLGVYYLLVGILNAEYAETREILPLYGFTQILPGQITTDVIRSADGKTYFDLANSEIGGRITFASGSSGLKNLSEWSGVQSQIDKANEDALKAQEEAEKAFNAQKAFAEQTTKDLEGLQDQIDGNITSWFYEGVPTLSNAPAKDWNTTDLKNNHLGDLYYDQNSGKAYRFQMNGSVYEWKLIADEDISKALSDAKDAQDTADAKRRVFFGTSTPTGEKDKGDLWTNGTDLYVWNGTSWEKATKYTDDTTANAAKGIAEDAKAVANTASANATNAASLANDAKALAETAKGAAEEAEGLIETANNYAKEAKEAAESSENAAKLSQQAAETAQQAVEDGQITVDESKRIAEDAKAASDAAQKASKEAEEAAIAAQQAAQSAQNLADEAKADAEKAAKDAEQAASDAKNASDRLDEWADDELVSPSDIPAIENELVYIAADKTDIDAQLEIYAIDNEDTISANFNTAYNDYEDALNAVLGLEIGAAFPTDLDDKQGAYYTQRTTILEAIAKAAKKVADDAQKTADDANTEATEAAKTAEEAKQNAQDALLAAQNAEAASQAAQEAAAAAQEKANEVSEKIDGDNYFTEIEKKAIRSIIAEITECKEQLYERSALVKFTAKQGLPWYLVEEDSKAEWIPVGEAPRSESQKKYAGYYSSNLHTSNGVTITQIDVELTEGMEVDIQLDYFSDSESTNDWMTVGARGTTVTPANTTTTSNTIPNRAGSTYGKQRTVFSKEYNMTQEVDAAKRYFQVAYKKNATTDFGTDSAYFRINNPHYIDKNGSLHIIELKGSFHSYYLLLMQKGYTEVADMLFDALNEIFGHLNANGLWTSGTTELTNGEAFRATLNEYLTDYYAILASCGFDIMDSKLADFDYLAGALKDGSKTITEGGLVMTSLVAVGDTSTTNADVEAFMNGSDFCKDNEHGKLIHAMGIPESVTEEGTEYTDLEKRSKAAQTRIYEDGTIISQNAELNEGCTIGGTVKVTANGIEVDNPNAWGKLTISDSQGLLRNDGNLNVQIGGSCAGAGLNISNGTPAHGVCYPRNSTEYVCATFATSPGKRAIAIFDGMIGGMRPNTVFKSSGETLTHLDHTCFAASGSIYLPSDPQIGQNYRIIHTSSSGLRVVIGTGDYASTFKNIGSLTITNLYIQSNKIEMIELIYDGSNWWYMTSRND